MFYKLILFTGDLLDLANNTIDSDSSHWYDGFIDGFDNFVQLIRNCYAALKGASAYMTALITKMDNLISHNSFDGINLNTYIGNIRYVVGDVIFYEIYVVLVLAIVIELFFAFSKLWQLITNLLSKAGVLGILTDSVRNLGLFKWFSKLF